VLPTRLQRYLSSNDLLAHLKDGRLLSVIRNSAWIILGRVLRITVTLLVGVWVARYLGPEAYGKYSFAYSYALIFATVALLGIRDLVVRDLVHYFDSRYEILGTTFVMLFVGALTTSVLSISLSYLVSSIERDTRLMIMVFTMISVFESAIIIDYWNQSQLQSKYTVIARTVPLIFVGLSRVLLIWYGATLVLFSFVAVLEAAIGAVVLVIEYGYTKESIRCWSYNNLRAKALLKEGYPLLIATMATVIYVRIGQLMIKQISGNEMAGLYAAATRLSQSWYFLITALASSLFPVIALAQLKGEKKYHDRLLLATSSLLIVSVLVALLIALLASRIVVPLYGPEFKNAESILAIHVWAGIPVALGLAANAWIMTQGLTQINLQRAVVGAVLNVVLNLVLIPRFGGVGAAIAALITFTVINVVWFHLDPRTRYIAKIQIAALTPWRYLRSSSALEST
jgi:O-antigen/teichoic acid export membrane protein